jgi:hypothetical protein
MAKDESSGQYAAKLLTLFAALVGGGGTVAMAGYDERVEVVAIVRDNWPGAPVIVRVATPDGYERIALDDIELAD